MIKIPERHISTVSWIDIFGGIFYAVAAVLGVLLIYSGYAPAPSSMSFNDYFLGIMLVILLLLSGLTLLDTGKNVKYVRHVAWLSIATGFIEIVNYILWITGVFKTIEITKGLLLISLIIEVSTSILLVVSGVYLRKILK